MSYRPDGLLKKALENYILALEYPLSAMKDVGERVIYPYEVDDSAVKIENSFKDLVKAYGFAISMGLQGGLRLKVAKIIDNRKEIIKQF